MVINTLICTSLTSKDVNQARKDILQAQSEGADLVEVRLDLMENTTGWSSLLASRPLPLIITNRANWEGGKCTQEESSRLEELLSAIKLGADYVDIELAAAYDFLAKLKSTMPCYETKIIISHHNYQGCLSQKELCDLCGQMKRLDADVCKVAMMATSVKDNQQVFDFLRATERVPDVICVAMGEFGTLSRVLAAKFGSFLTYTALSTSKVTAPGQISTREMKENFASNFIVPSTTVVYGVLGKSPNWIPNFKVINGELRKLKLNKVCVPVSESSSEDLDSLLKMFAEKYDFDRFFTSPVDHSFQSELGSLFGKSGCCVDAVRVVKESPFELIGYRIYDDNPKALNETDRFIHWHIELLKNIADTDLPIEVETLVRSEIQNVKPKTSNAEGQ